MKYLFSLFFIGLLIMGCGKEEQLSQEEQLAIDRASIEQYLSDNNLTAEVTPEGIYYIIEEPGTGGNPDVFSTVIVNYKGYFLDGEVFDQTPGSPITFALTSVIAGWTLGIPLFQKGGKGTLLIPSYLGYGTIGQGPIGPNTPLIFDVELINFN